MITLDASEFNKLVAEMTQVNLESNTKRQVAGVVRQASFAVEKRIKGHPPEGMPVDMGIARASWGHWTQQHLRGAAKTNVMQDVSVWREEDDGLSITQGSNLPYIGALNDGHSRQSPAGFIDRAQLLGQLILEEELGMIDPLSDDYQGRLYVAKFG